VAARVKPNVSYQAHDGYALSACEAFALLNGVVARADGAAPAEVELADTPFGPSGKGPNLAEPVTTDWSQFTRTAADVDDYLKRHGRVPTAVWLGSVPVPPEAYLEALARVVPAVLDGKPPEKVEVRPAKLAAAAFVAEDNPKLWGWVIFPRGFRAPAMMELAKRQAWTLKPALLAHK
jgi:hypothetical protein